MLAERLTALGYTVGVLDLSAVALERAKARLSKGAASAVRWILADVTETTDFGEYDVWHDRAVFRFLTDPADRARYVSSLGRTVRTGGHAVIATFAPDGPERCSGLPICRYDGPALAAALGPEFRLLRSVPEMHHTPSGKQQSFQYSVFQRDSACDVGRPE